MHELTIVDPLRRGNYGGPPIVERVGIGSYHSLRSHFLRISAPIWRGGHHGRSV